MTNLSTFRVLILLLLCVVLVAAGYYFYTMDKTLRTTPVYTPSETQTSNKDVSSGQELANPASVNCTEKGGELQIETRGDGGEYGVCIFEDNYQCEEWALLKGECPVGGVRVTGFDTKAQVYCAISGGETLAVANATCTFPDGSSCPVEEYYKGTCQRDQT